MKDLEVKFMIIIDERKVEGVQSKEYVWDDLFITTNTLFLFVLPKLYYIFYF